MADYFASMVNAVVDRSPDELIGAILIALALSLAMAGLYYTGRRKVSENLMPMVVLMIVANLASMTFGAGYLARARKQHVDAARPIYPSSPAVSERMLIDAIFRAADENRDGLLSGEEASVAADKFVRRHDSAGHGAIDARSLASALLAVEFHGRGRSLQPGRGIEAASAKSPIHPDGTLRHETSLPEAADKAGPPTPAERKDHVSARDDAEPNDTVRTQPTHSAQ